MTEARRRLLLVFGFAVLVLFTCMGGPVALWLLGGGRPNIAVNYIDKINERAAAVPDADRAWPVYERLLTSGDWDDALMEASDRLRSGDPGGEGWDEAAAVLDSKRALFDLIREAASMPGMGFVVTAPSPGPNQPGGPSAPPWLMQADFVQHAHMRHLARHLVSDALLAAHRHDGARFADDMTAMMRLGAHTNEHGTVISQLVENAIVTYGCRTIREAIGRHPGAFGEQDLARLDALLSGLNGGEPFRLDLSGERMFFDDTVQRIFTDDGNGDGHITADGVSVLGTLGGSSGPALPAGASRIGIGAARLVSSRRAEVMARYDDWVDRIEPWTDRPVWERESIGFDTEAARLGAANPLDIGMQMLAMLVPALDKAATATETINGEIAGTRLVIALERARLRLGEWPASLSQLDSMGLGPVPADPFDGNPVRYVLGDAGPVVYSVGVDRDDDGGRAVSRSRAWLPADAARRKAASDPDYDGDWVFFPPDTEGEGGG